MEAPAFSGSRCAVGKCVRAKCRRGSGRVRIPVCLFDRRSKVSNGRHQVVNGNSAGRCRRGARYCCITPNMKRYVQTEKKRRNQEKCLFMWGKSAEIRFTSETECHRAENNQAMQRIGNVRTQENVCYAPAKVFDISYRR
jgi:hypothetical protein